MAGAQCTKCGAPYSWHGGSGCRLADNPSPCCNAPGKANRYSAHRVRAVKTCPDCHKGGLWYRKACLDPEIWKLRQGMSQEDIYHGLWCPRCKKWVRPVVEAAA